MQASVPQCFLSLRSPWDLDREHRSVVVAHLSPGVMGVLSTKKLMEDEE